MSSNSSQILKKKIVYDSMKLVSSSDKLYTLYSRALWHGESKLINKYKTSWLHALEKNLPSGSLRKFYRIKIDSLLVFNKPETDKLENYLLKQRFNFIADIRGKDYSYRDLLSANSEEPDNNEITQALLDETKQLIKAGFAELICQRNIMAKERGYENYWSYKNSEHGNIIRNFLINMDRYLRNYKVKYPPKTTETKYSVDYNRAFEFYRSLLFSNQTIPKFELLVRKGSQCPQGPPFVQSMAYRPDRGHLIGLNLPFVQENRIENKNMGAFFHELTHLFHFAAVDSRGGHAFPSELARDDLLYESEALCYQNLILSAWKKVVYSPDMTMMKDLVYVAETEKQLYEMEYINEETIHELIVRRIKEHYPRGDYKRTPLGASHLIRKEFAGKYWIYAASHWIGNKRIKKILKSGNAFSVPDYWSEGNEASYRFSLKEFISSQSMDTLLS